MEYRPQLTAHFKKEEKPDSVDDDNEGEKNENGCKINEKAAQDNGQNGKKNVKSETFWTVCPYCYNMYEYDKGYEECCLRCQNCRRAFHGVAVVEPNKNILVEGKDEYYCGLGYFSLMYPLNGDLMRGKKKKERRSEIKSYNADTVVEISDDDCRGKGMNVKSDGSKLNAGGEEHKGDVLMEKVNCSIQRSGKTEVGNEGQKVVTRKNVKSVARKLKKVMGRGEVVKNRKIEAGSESAGGIRDDCSDE